MTRLLLAIAAALTLSSCEPVGQGWVKPTRTNTSFTIEVHFDEAAALPERCAAMGAWSSAPTGRQEVGCTKFYLDRNHCEVFVPRPQQVDDKATEVLGHEVLHCVYGRYHP